MQERVYTDLADQENWMLCIKQALIQWLNEDIESPGANHGQQSNGRGTNS